MNSCCSNALLESALAGNLPAENESALHRHLEACEACSAALERIAGGTAWCQEAASLLAADELDPDTPTRDEWSEVDFTVEHLEPADEPNVLGRLGGYDVLEVIGHGGMGVVLKGFDRELKRYVAIKVLAPHLAHSAQAKKRFVREAQAAAAVVHAHVMAIHQVQPHGRLPFLVMPLVAGESLAERLAAQGALELKEILRIGMQAAAGLAAAHEQGLVHRDVKPANILLEKGVERAVLTDFGLARAADDVTLTRYGIIAGTPQYMSPEQAQGEVIDCRSDLFSLGCVLYEMASGVSPFRADSMMATLRRLVDEPPQALASLNPELPPWFVAIVQRLLEKDPSRRFSSAKEVSELLEGCLAHLQQPANVPLPAGLPVAPALRQAPRWSKNRGIGIIAAILLVATGGIAAFIMLTGEPSDISGEWTGDGWGKVVLHRTGPTEYAATYTDTVGKEPGKIELKWSRIERRYNGAWSEGKDRFGKISVRQVGDEIRGALTTDRASKINPGTPELADLLWVRAKPAPQGKDNWTFGPTLARTLICPTGNATPLGAKALRLEDGKLFNLPKDLASPEKFDEWCSEARVNLVIDYRKETDQWEMKLRAVAFAELPETPSDAPKDWKTPGANELQQRFSKLDWNAGTADANRKTSEFRSLLLTRGMNPPVTFAFETSDGHRGILQFYASNAKAIGYRDALIRYKQIQPDKLGATAPSSPAQPAELKRKTAPAPQGKDKWTFGPTLALTLICPTGNATPLGAKALRLEDGKLFNLPKDLASPEKLDEWCNETKVNLVIDYRKETDQWEMKLRDLKFAELPETPSDSSKDWKTPGANELQQRFSKLEWKAGAAEANQKTTAFRSLMLTRGMNPPMTFAFETSGGHRGIVQFYASNAKAIGYRNALIRYKQLEPDNLGETGPSPPAQPDESKQGK
jgi:tRNA A-37 threonylcarbamoyl transferase component Bud32